MSRRRFRNQFASSWWGRAWVEALEDRAQLDPNRLPRGRTYARQARVRQFTVAPGLVSADVQGSDWDPYEVEVRVRMFPPKEWEAALDAIAARAAHAAALLDGELDPGIVDDLQGAGVGLLPGPGELGPYCSCPDWADPCKHAAAVCYLVASLLDDDPFVLLHLRGREREDVLAEVRSRRAQAVGAASRPRRDRADDDEGIPAREAYALAAEAAGATGAIGATGATGAAGVAGAVEAAAGRNGGTEPVLPAFPAVPLPPDRPQDPAPPVVGLPATLGATGELLELSRDAARRAWELATGQSDGGLSLDATADLARRAALALEARAPIDGLAKHSGEPRRRVVSLGVAWQAGGVDGVQVLDEPWDPPAEDLAEARTALLEDAPARTRVRVSRNRVSRSDGVQLRFGRDRRWYRFRRQGRSWEPTSTPDVDPRQLLPTSRAPSPRQ
jgi:uncharacterized Zn finger protein